jgi:hypothetical protein
MQDLLNNNKKYNSQENKNKKMFFKIRKKDNMKGSEREDKNKRIKIQIR